MSSSPWSVISNGVIISAITVKSLLPEIAIDSWRHWGAGLGSRPVLSGALSGGRSNRSFLLDSDSFKMVLRLNGDDSLLPGSNRTSEIDIWQAASHEGIAPPLLYVDEHTRYLVSTYIESTLPPQPQLDENFIDQAFSLLSRCHQLDIEAPSIDYTDHIKKYWDIIEGKDHIGNPGLRQQRQAMQGVLEDILSSGTPMGLCHHDPVIVNFVGSTKRLYLIDWEYAAHGLLVMDYAALGIEWGIDDATIVARTGLVPEELMMAKSLYRYLCALWKEIT
jgi:thiamine kinase-like enzyme